MTPPRAARHRLGAHPAVVTVEEVLGREAALLDSRPVAPRRRNDRTVEIFAEQRRAAGPSPRPRPGSPRDGEKVLLLPAVPGGPQPS